MTENIVQFQLKKKLTTRQKTGILVLRSLSTIELAKEKVDEYFGIEDCKNSQMWFYGSSSLCVILTSFILTVGHIGY